MPITDTTKPLTNEVRELHEKLEKLTGRRPTSRDERHLRRQLGKLQDAKKSGEPVRRYGDPTINISVSMPSSVREALEDVVNTGKHGSTSVIVRHALELWAKENGVSKLVKALA